MSDNPQAISSGLIRLGGKLPLRHYLRQVWERREFALVNAQGALQAEHMDTVLGNLWHILNPAFLIAIYYLIFGVILDITRGVDNLVGFLAVGVFTFQFAQSSILTGARTIVRNEGLIRSLQFPRILLPVSEVLKEALAFLSSTVVIAAVVLVTGEPLTLSWLLAIPVFLLTAVLSLGGSFITARLGDRFRDTVNILPYLFRLLFYMSGIIYPVEQRFDDPSLRVLFLANPFYCLVSLARQYLMETESYSDDEWMWVSLVAWTVAIFFIGFFVFRAGEKEYGRG